MFERDRSDDGATLVELLMAMMILGTAVVAIVYALGTAVLTSDMHRKQASAGAIVRSVGEELKAAAYDAGCSASYAVPAGLVPAGFQAQPISVSYWNASSTAFEPACPGGTDSGVQRLTLAVQSTDLKAVEKLVVVIRRPCRLTDLPCPAVP